MNCDSEILEQTDCQVWTCYKHSSSGKNGNYLIFVAIAFGIIALLLAIIGLWIVCRSNRQAVTQSQENLEGISQNAIHNRNSYFSIDSSSSENFGEENLDEQTPIIRPKFRISNVQQ